MSKEEKYKFIKPLKQKPSLPARGAPVSKTKLAAQEFIDSGAKYAEAAIEGYTTTSLARALGRALHGKRGLDPNNHIEVRSDKLKKKVYLLRK